MGNQLMSHPIFENLIADGFEQRAPDPTSAAIDRAICAESVCAQCKKAGLIYLPYYNPHMDSYRAFCFCPQCGEVTEF